MKHAFLLLTALFLVGTVVWAIFNGQWESAYVVQRDLGEHQYLIDLDSRPLWSRPAAPSFADYSERFTNDGEPLPPGGTINVYHRWDWWILGILIIWLVGSLVITPIAFLQFRGDRSVGAVARVGAALIGAALICFLLWLLIGGWGPPAPLFFGIVGLSVGALWAIIHVSRNIISEQGAGSSQRRGGTGDGS